MSREGMHLEDPLVSRSRRPAEERPGSGPSTGENGREPPLLPRVGRRMGGVDAPVQPQEPAPVAPGPDATGLTPAAKSWSRVISWSWRPQTLSIRSCVACLSPHCG